MPNAGEFVVAVSYLSVDPAMRRRIDGVDVRSAVSVCRRQDWALNYTDDQGDRV
jgi:NADPH-dependent curcumin reductase CurA